MTLLQNAMMLTIMLGYAMTEFISRRYKDYQATRDDGKLELFMFLSLILVSLSYQRFVFGKRAEEAG